MNVSLRAVRRCVIASAPAIGFGSTGIAASAQTTTAPAAPTAIAAGVSSSTVDANEKRQLELEQMNADARRIAFLHLGTSL